MHIYIYMYIRFLYDTKCAHEMIQSTLCLSHSSVIKSLYSCLYLQQPIFFPSPFFQGTNLQTPMGKWCWCKEKTDGPSLEAKHYSQITIFYQPKIPWNRVRSCEVPIIWSEIETWYYCPTSFQPIVGQGDLMLLAYYPRNILQYEKEWMLLGCLLPTYKE